MYKPSRSNYVTDDEYENLNFKSKKKNNKNLSLIFVILIALVFGVVVFLLSSLFFSGSKTNNNQNQGKKESISINDKNVKKLYSYITYGPNNNRYTLFIKQKKVEQDNISNLDKYLYAMQFITKDDALEKNINNTKTYYIKSSVIKNAIKKMYGNNIKYIETSEVSIVLDFTIDNKNKGTMTYDNSLDGYILSLTDLSQNQEEIIKPHYEKLKSAEYKDNNSINIKESIIYVTYKKNEDNSYSYKVYSDYEHTVLIDNVENISLEQLQKTPITINDYKDIATTITYNFKLDDNNNYYFNSSSIDY